MSLDRSISFERLSFTAFLAVSVHAIILFGIDWTSRDSPSVAPTLNITLATHRDETPPDEADFLAQHNQQASGTVEDVRELTTRELAEVAAPNIQRTAVDPQRESVPDNASEQQYLHAQNSDLQVRHFEPSEDQPDPRDPLDAEDKDVPEINPEIASLRARLDQLQEDFAKRPRIRRMTSVATRSSADAEYLNQWTQKVELMGNQHFPQSAIDQRLFGSLRLSVLLNSDGSVAQVEILKPSGYPVLDQAALQVIRLASPFEPFPPEIRKGADQLDIIRTWRFEITGLTTGSAAD